MQQREQRISPYPESPKTPGPPEAEEDRSGELEHVACVLLRFAARIAARRALGKEPGS
jgi:hypothetical protein